NVKRDVRVGDRGSGCANQDEIIPFTGTDVHSTDCGSHRNGGGLSIEIDRSVSHVAVKRDDDIVAVLRAENAYDRAVDEHTRDGRHAAVFQHLQSGSNVPSVTMQVHVVLLK